MSVATDPVAQPTAWAAPPHRRAGWAVALLLTTLVAVVFIRIRLAPMPMERDEGEYAYFGQLMLQGVPPYQAAYSMKWPGTYAAYAAFMAVFGQSAVVIRSGVTLVILATALFVFLIGKRCMDVSGGCIAAAVYAVMSISPAVLGLAAHSTHFVLLPALAGAWLVQLPADHPRLGRLMLAGAAVGGAAMMKQTGAAFLGFLVFWVALCAVRQKAGFRTIAIRSATIAAGFAIPVALLFGWVAFAGSFARFWFWTWDYARTYASLVSPGKGAVNLAEYIGRIFTVAPILAALSVVGAAALLCRKPVVRHRGFLLGLSAFSFLATCPGLYFSGNYMIQMNPALALLAALGVQAGQTMVLANARLVRLGRAFGLFAASGVAQALLLKADVFFLQTPQDASRTIYGFNPLPETEVIGRFLEAQCHPGARIAVVGSEPEIYFYAKRRAVTGYMYLYPMTENQPYSQRMQTEFMEDVDRGAPDYVVFVSCISSWFSSSRMGTQYRLMRWFKQYEKEHLTLVGLAEMTDEGTKYHWSFHERKLKPPATSWVAVFRRIHPPTARSTAGSPPAIDDTAARTTLAW